MTTRTPYVYDITTKTALTGPKANFSEITLLVVDNCQPFRKMIMKVLLRFGFQAVYEAANGEEAIDQIRHHHIDIVMTEWSIEPFNGYELIRRLRTDKRLADEDMRLIMLTGLTEKARVVAARDAGVDGFLRKPVSPDTLFKRIVSVIDNPVGYANMRAAQAAAALAGEASARAGEPIGQDGDDDSGDGGEDAEDDTADSSSTTARSG